jgi:hypothetical protein
MRRHVSPERDELFFRKRQRVASFVAAISLTLGIVSASYAPIRYLAPSQFVVLITSLLSRRVWKRCASDLARVQSPLLSEPRGR